ncbi:MAG: PQQ-binding-like beta-propeller repeat protein [Planctomycetales bacterium]|nr:PQQ-binding-like beta-propeller repeat protein [Planctomycetales bacterium]
MPIAGDFAKIPAGSVLALVRDQGRAGLLTVRTDSKEVTLYLNGEGARLFSVDGQKAVRIGDVLLEMERVTEFQLKHALERQAESKRLLGEILVELGLVTEQEIQQAIKLQVEEEFFELLALPAGQFQFTEQELPESDYRPDPKAPDHFFPLDYLLGDLARRVEEWRKHSSEFQGDGDVFLVPSSAKGPVAALGEGSRRKLADLLDGENTLGDLVHRMMLPRDRIYRLLVELVRDGIARRATADELRKAARGLREEKKVKQSVKLLERAFSMAPDDAEVVRELAELYEGIGDKKRAGSFSKVLADLLWERGDRESAVLLCQKVIEFLPSDPYPFERIVEHTVEQGLHERALEAAKTLLRLYQQDGKIEKATELTTTFLGMFPEDLALHERMVNLHVAANRKKEAVAEYDAMAKLLAADSAREPAVRDRDLLEIYQKIALLDPGRPEIQKEIERLSGGTAEVAQRRRSLRRRLLVGVGLLLLVLGGLGGLYEARGRSEFADAEGEARRLEESSELDEARSVYNRFLALYRWSSRAGEVERRVADLTAKIEERDRRLRERARQLDEILQSGEKDLRDGKLDEAEKTFQSVAEQDRDGDHGRRAAAKLREVAEKRRLAKRERIAAILAGAAAAEREAVRERLFGGRDQLKGALALEPDPDQSRQLQEALDRLGVKIRELLFGDAQRHYDAGLAAERETRFEDAVNAYTLAKTALLHEVFTGSEDGRSLREAVTHREGDLARQITLGRERLSRARGLEAEGKYDDALAILNLVLAENPFLQEVRERKLALPLRIESVPAGATVRRGSEKLGVTPCVVHYQAPVSPPGAAFEVELAGYRTATVRGDTTRAVVSLTLEKTWLWSLRAKGPVLAAPLVGRDRVYFGADNTLHALDFSRAVAPGAAPPEAWTHSAGGIGLFAATPCLRDGVLYAPCRNENTLHAVGEDGSLRWKSEKLPRRPLGPALPVPGGRIAVLLEDGRVLGLGAGDGVRAWAGQLPTGPAQPAVEAGGLLVAAGDDRQLHALDGRTGERGWAAPLPGGVSGPLATLGDRVLVPAGPALAVVVVPAAGDPPPPAVHRLEGGDVRGVAGAGDAVVLTTSGGFLVARALADPAAAPRWRIPLGGGLSVPAILGGDVVVGTRKGEVHCRALADGAARWVVKLPRAVVAPSAAWGNLILVPCEDGNLYAIER